MLLLTAGQDVKSRILVRTSLGLTVKRATFICITAVPFFIVFQVIKAAEDSTLQYMNFMNVIFAAQKKVGIKKTN